MKIIPHVVAACFEVMLIAEIVIVATKNHDLRRKGLISGCTKIYKIDNGSTVLG